MKYVIAFACLLGVAAVYTLIWALCKAAKIGDEQNEAAERIWRQTRGSGC